MSIEKVLTSFTCPLFQEVPEAVYRARWDAMKEFGEQKAAAAMMQRPEETPEEEEWI